MDGLSNHHTGAADEAKLQVLRDLANKLRVDTIAMTNHCKSGHPTSCCSIAEVISVLFFEIMKYKVSDPRDPSSDRFVLSKGHACPILYAAWSEAGLFPKEDLMNLRKYGCDLEGHPTPRLNFIDVATGSLGQGLSCAAGMAYTGKYFDKASYRVYCVLGDGECAEGSVWEAFSFASYYKLDNLVAIIDCNKFGQSDETSLKHDTEAYRRRVEAFGFHTCVVDGHDVAALLEAFFTAATVKDKPTCIIAKTLKGKGVKGVEDNVNYHGKIVGPKAEEALVEIKAQIQKDRNGASYVKAPVEDTAKHTVKQAQLSEAPNYTLGQKVAIRAAYGTALVKMGKGDNRVISLDGDMRVSTHSYKFRDAFPDRFIEGFIAEQNIVGVAIGCATRDRCIPFISTYGSFLTRAFDQIRMGAISQTNTNFVGSHGGVSIGVDGPSQMALEDLAMFRAVPGSTVFYPSDAVSCERAVELAANTKGICYIRASRPDVPVIYGNDEQFEIGKAKVVRQSAKDKVTVIGSCVTLAEAIKAAETLANDIPIRVIDPFTVKPMDGRTIIENAKATGGKILTVEDHYPEGGLGEAVLSAVSHEPGITVRKLAIMSVPRSGEGPELVANFGIDSTAIIKAVREMVA